MKLVIVTMIGLTLALMGCEEKEEGESIGAPLVEPPVTRNIPAGLKTASFAADGGLSPAPSMDSAIKGYLYPSDNGPSPITRLAKIDERMASLNSRAEESPRKCMENGASAWELPAALPTGESFPMFFQCQETLNAESTLAFGLHEGEFYLIEQTGQSSGDEAITVLVKAKEDGSVVDTWTIAYQANGHGEGTGPVLSYMHIKATDGTGIEVTTAGNAFGYILSCGIHLKSNNDHVYVAGSLTWGSACSEATTTCYEASGMTEQDVATCSGANLNTFDLPTVSQEMAQATMESILPIFDQKVSTFIEFNEDK